MKIINPKEDISFNEKHAIAEPIFINKNNRILRFSLLPGQSIKEHKSPSSPVFINIIKGRGIFWGEDGVLEAGANSTHICWFQNGRDKPIHLDLPPGRQGAYLESFLSQVNGGQTSGLASCDVLAAARIALRVQEAADQRLTNVSLPTS